MNGGQAVFSAPSGDPAALERLADELDGHAKVVGGLSSDHDSYTSLARSNAEWSGNAADAYTSFTNGVSKGVSGIPSPLNNVASAIRNYAGILRSVQ